PPCCPRTPPRRRAGRPPRWSSGPSCAPPGPRAATPVPSPTSARGGWPATPSTTARPGAVRLGTAPIGSAVAGSWPLCATPRSPSPSLLSTRPGPMPPNGSAASTPSWTTASSTSPTTAGSPCPVDRLHEDLPQNRLLASVVLHDVTAADCGCAFRIRVQITVVRVRSQPVAEDPTTDRLSGIGAEHVDVRARRGVPEQAVALPPRLTHGQDEARCLERRDVAVLVVRVRDDDVDVDDRLGRQARDRRRPDVVDTHGGRTQRARDDHAQRPEVLRPPRV